MNTATLLQTAPTISAHRPSLLSANGLYLSVLLLIVGLGSIMQMWSISWGLLITEVGLILLPTLVLMRLTNLNAPEVLMLRWPGTSVALLSALIGAGVWGVSAILESISGGLFGYTPPSPFASMPTDAVNLLVFFIALVVAAPVCEEVLFRGYLLSAYSRFKPLVSLLAVSALFAFFHLRLQGLLALLPIALTLGYLTQRSHSLIPAIIVHSVNNALSASIVIITVLQPSLITHPTWPMLLYGVMFIGPLVALAALWLFRRITPAPSISETGAPINWQALWPLVGAGLIYLAFASLELITGRFPHWLAEPTLQLKPAPWSQPLTVKYDLRNVVDEVVGEAECTFTPQAALVAFECVTRQRNFEVQLRNSFFAGGQYELKQSGHWQASSMLLQDASLQFTGEYKRWEAVISSTGAGLNLKVSQGPTQSIPADSVVAAEWPWRLMALPFEQSFYWGSRFSLVTLASNDDTGRTESTAVLLIGRENLTTANGLLQTWKVKRGPETAWYSVENPHLLLKYSDGFGVTWILRSAPAQSTMEITP